jgi:hypothetical protein
MKNQDQDRQFKDYVHRVSKELYFLRKWLPFWFLTFWFLAFCLAAHVVMDIAASFSNHQAFEQTHRRRALHDLHEGNLYP